MNKRLAALLQRKAAAVEKMKTIRAEAGEDVFTAEQTAAFDAMKAEAGQLQAAIQQEEAAIEIERTSVAMPLRDGAIIENGVDQRTLNPTRGFAHFGQFLSSVKAAALRPSAVDERLNFSAAATTYANESVGADGGFLVPPSYSSEIMSVIESGEALLPMTRQIPIAGTEFKYPVNETTAHGSTGVTAYWDSEGDTITQSKPVFKNGSIKLDRLTALAPVTEEALEDAAAIGAWIQMEAAAKMADKVNNAILNGTGAGSPLGIVVAPGTVSVAKESSQVAATIVGENVVKMWSRMPAANRARAVWLAHSDCDVQLAQMNFKVKNVAGTENVGGIPVFMPPGTVNSTPYATLFGRPVMTMERCAALGTVGDFILADMSQYIAVTKGGVKAEQSMHFYFDQNARAFRFVLRLGGQPWLSAAIARANGSSTLGHFVTLATRG